MNDIELLREYTERGSETAFRELVRRHLNLVHSVALRQVRDPQLAEEVSQAVFILLARKATSLNRNVIVAGWLFRTTRFVAARVLRSERRRHHREQEAFQMQSLSQPDETWNRIAPTLDSALEQLDETERNAILLRFFEDQNHKQVGTALGLTEDAARKRIARALERLRNFFVRRGFTVSAAVLVSALAANAVKAAPVGLEATVAGAGLAGAASSAALPVLVSETLAAWRWMKIKIGAAFTISGAAIVAIVVALAQGTSSSSPPLPSSRSAVSPSDSPVAAVNSNQSVLAARRATARATASFRLRLVAEDTGEPVAQARVGIVVLPDDNWNPRFNLVTDESGVCDIRLPQEIARLHVGAVAHGWGAKYMTWSPDNDGPPPSEYTLKLERLTKSVGGWVRDLSGKPVGGAEIIIQFGGGGDYAAYETPRERAGFAADVPAAISDRDGHWSFSLIPTRHFGFSIHARHPDFAETSVESGGYDYEDPRRNDWQRESFRQLWAGTLVTTLKPALTLIGRVTDTAGEPIAGATVAHAPHAIHPRVLQTDGDGIFAFDGLGERALELSVSAPGYAPEYRQVNMATNTERVNIQLKPGAVLRLHLVDESGADVSDVEVGLEQWGENRFALKWEAKSDAEGRIEWKSAPLRETLELCAVKRGWCYTRNIQVIADGTEQTIQMHRAVLVTGQVTDADSGLPVERFKVIPGYGQGQSEAVWYRSDSRTGTNGSFELSFTEKQQPWQVRFEAPGYLTAVSGPISQSFTGQLAIALQRETADKKISGVVRTPDGSPAAGADVALCTFEQMIGVTLVEYGFKPERSSIVTRTDDDGRFTFVPRPEAHTVIAVHASGFARARVSPKVQPMQIQLQPWGRIEGTVSGDREQGMSAQLSDWASSQYQGGMCVGAPGFSAPVDSEGRFTLEKVPPGNFFVSLKRNLGSGTMGSTPVTIPPGETARIQIGGSGIGVTGKFSVGEVEGITDWPGQTMIATLAPKSHEPLPVPKGLSPEARKRWELEFWQSDAGQARLNNNRERRLAVGPDGSFLGYDVLPGSYTLILQVTAKRNGYVIGQLSESVVIPEKSDSTGETVDLGTHALHRPRP